MNFFDILNYCSKKAPLSGGLNNEQIESLANPFLLQRYLSMATSDHAIILNETTNRWWALNFKKDQNDDNPFTTELFLKFSHHILPQHLKFIKYLKKTSESPDQ